jgi:hypothetical protein
MRVAFDPCDDISRWSSRNPPRIAVRGRLHPYPGPMTLCLAIPRNSVAMGPRPGGSRKPISDDDEGAVARKIVSPPNRLF